MFINMKVCKRVGRRAHRAQAMLPVIASASNARLLAVFLLLVVVITALAGMDIDHEHSHRHDRDLTRDLCPAAKCFRRWPIIMVSKTHYMYLRRRPIYRRGRKVRIAAAANLSAH